MAAPRAYGLGQPLIELAQKAIQSVRNPTVNDRAQIGTIWCNTVAQTAYILVAVSANQSIWVQSLNSNVFNTITVNGPTLINSSDFSVIPDTTSGASPQTTYTLDARVGSILSTGWTLYNNDVVFTINNSYVTRTNAVMVTPSCNSSDGDAADGIRITSLQQDTGKLIVTVNALSGGGGSFNGDIIINFWVLN